MKTFYTPLLVAVVIAVLFFGCGGSSLQPNGKCKEREWMLNPNKDGVIGAVGISARTYSGTINSQRKLAIMRALDELSLQQGVKVKLRIDKKDVVTNGRSNTSIKSNASYKVNNRVTAHIEDACIIESSGEFAVWMVID
ncbi:MAG TPA: hypothetical protein EYH11_05280 [Sulfurimonas autotrophica]|nr:hypothetical protein [Sulfurimonas autotrophica]